MTLESAPRPRTVQVNGTELTYLEQGEGDPIVFVHGSLGDYRVWLELLGPFAERYRTIAMSRRAHYPNAWTDGYTSCLPEVHAADLAALIEALETGPVHLYGHSYGGLVSLVLATRRPELVRTLTLGEPPLFRWLERSEEGRALFAAFSATSLEPARQSFQQGDPESAVSTFLDGVIGEGVFDQIPPPVQAAIMDNAEEMRVELETPPETFFSTLKREDVERLPMPVLLLLGELSPTLFQHVTGALARCLPDAERATIPGVSHDLYNPPVFQETLLGFMARH